MSSHDSTHQTIDRLNYEERKRLFKEAYAEAKYDFHLATIRANTPADVFEASVTFRATVEQARKHYGLMSEKDDYFYERW